MSHVLLIDDDEALLDLLAMAMADEGYRVSTASDGARGLGAIREDRPALVVADVNMPGLDGFTLCRRLREAGDPLPIILLTSRDSEIDEALGLELGADDYVTKPCSTRVLLARVAALLRREALRGSNAVGAAAALLRRGHLELDAERLSVAWRGAEIRVTVTEFRLVETLARRPGVVFSRPMLLERIRGDDSVVAERLVDTYVRRLRRKFEEVEEAFEGIETVVGAGYRWREGG